MYPAGSRSQRDSVPAGRHPVPTDALGLVAPELRNQPSGGGGAVHNWISAMNETHRETEAQQIEVINTGEELLLKARTTARQIERRVWQAMDEHGLGAPHRPRAAEE
jgi:hypothetical protein